MAYIEQLLENIEEVNVNEILEESFTDLSGELVRLQRDQMMHGYASDGIRIGKYKNDKYAQKKFDLSPLAGYGWKDLFLTGEFQRNIFVDVRATELIFDSGDSKTDKILEREGEEVFGLNPQSIEKVLPELSLVAAEKIANVILR